MLRVQCVSNQTTGITSFECTGIYVRDQVTRVKYDKYHSDRCTHSQLTSNHSVVRSGDCGCSHIRTMTSYVSAIDQHISDFLIYLASIACWMRRSPEWIEGIMRESR